MNDLVPHGAFDFSRLQPGDVIVINSRDLLNAGPRAAAAMEAAFMRALRSGVPLVMHYCPRLCEYRIEVVEAES